MDTSVTEDARITSYWIVGLLVAAIATNAIAIKRALGAERGIASIYGDDNDGYAWGPTASGEKMNPGAMIAAHRTLPFNTRVTVTNKRNGKHVVVRIVDRGPFKHGRIIDLSPVAGAALGCDGLCPVELEVL